MARARNLEAKITRREMYWSDVDIISKYKKKVVRWGTLQNEADRDVIHRMVEEFVKNHKPETEIPVSTYLKKEEATPVTVE